MKIAVDAMGGDFAPAEIVKGAVKAAREYKVNIILVGKKPVLHVLAGKHLKKLGMSIVHAPQVVGFQEHPMEALKTKPKSSIAVGINLLKEGKVDAFVSAGATGIVFASALFMLGKIKAVERPSIASIINLGHSVAPFMLVDSGANADCRAGHLLHFARMGNLYANRIFGLAAPRIALLSNGGEETKGNRVTVEAHQMLKASGLNFVGNMEGNDIVSSRADVIVTDGFTGNILLKAMEGLGESFIKLKSVHGPQDGSHKLTGRALLASVGMDFLIKGMDYTEYGGACLLGVKGNVIISHGRSKAKAIKNAIGLAVRTAERDVSRLLGEVKYESVRAEV
jgi:glycerol-3-phosphate acyltransferase PlsX